MTQKCLSFAVAAACLVGLPQVSQRAVAQESSGAGTGTAGTADSGQATPASGNPSTSSATQADTQPSPDQSTQPASSPSSNDSGDTADQQPAANQSTTPSDPPATDRAAQSKQLNSQSDQTNPLGSTSSANSANTQQNGIPQDNNSQNQLDANQQQGTNQQQSIDAAGQGRFEANRQSRGRDSRDFNIGIQFGVPTARGLVIDTIANNSVFFDSGLRRGDVVVSLFGRPVRNQADFVRWIHMNPGQRVPVVVWRDGRQETIYVVYDQQPMPNDQVMIDRPQAIAGSQAHLGVMFDVQARNAAVVRDVTPGSPAEQAGLQPGDRIVALNGREIGSYQDVIQVVRMMQPGEQLMIDFSRPITNQAQVVLGSRPADGVRTATAPGTRYEVGYPPERPVYSDRPFDSRLQNGPREPMIEGGIAPPERPLRDRPLLPQLPE